MEPYKSNVNLPGVLPILGTLDGWVVAFLFNVTVIFAGLGGQGSIVTACWSTPLPEVAPLAPIADKEVVAPLTVNVASYWKSVLLLLE